MKQLMIMASVPFILVLAFALAGCGTAASGASGGSSAATNTIFMNGSNFTQHSITVPANTPVSFSDTVDGGGTHILCLGTGNGGSTTCDTTGNVPAGLLGSGTTFNPGQVTHFTFTTPGTYRIICTIHPGMYIDVTAR